MTHKHTQGQYRKQLKEGLPTCAECREVANAWHRRYRKERELGYPERRTPIVEVRDLLDELFGQGHSKPTLSRATGLSTWTLHTVIYGPNRKWVATSIYEKLLNVGPPRLEDLPPARQVAAHGTRRRLQALLRQEWPLAEIGRQTGLNAPSLGRLVSGQANRVEVRVALKIRDFAESYGHLTPTHIRKRDRTAARNRALREGWASMMAWDGINIDDVRAKPRGVAAA